MQPPASSFQDVGTARRGTGASNVGASASFNNAGTAFNSADTNFGGSRSPYVSAGARGFVPNGNDFVAGNVDSFYPKEVENLTGFSARAG